MAGAKLTKTAAYQDLAEYVNTKCSTNWTKDACQNRYTAYYKLYKETKAAFDNVNGEKYCLTELDLKNGVTIDKKLEKDCPYFYRLDALFGSRQNIKPSYTMEPLHDTVPIIEENQNYNDAFANDDSLSSTSSDSLVDALPSTAYFLTTSTSSSQEISTPFQIRAPSPALTQSSNNVTITSKTKATQPQKKSRFDLDRTLGAAMIKQEELEREKFEATNKLEREKFEYQIRQDLINRELAINKNDTTEIKIACYTEFIRKGLTAEEIVQQMDILFKNNY
jgi:hypothetical protein